MKIIKAKEDFTLHGVLYSKGDEMENLKIEEIINLNEKGFIEPLTQKEIISLIKDKENENKIINKPQKTKEGE